MDLCEVFLDNITLHVDTYHILAFHDDVYLIDDWLV